MNKKVKDLLRCSIQEYLDVKSKSVIIHVVDVLVNTFELFVCINNQIRLHNHY